MALEDCDSEDAMQLLASGSTCDIIAADSQQPTRVMELTQEDACSSPGQHCEGTLLSVMAATEHGTIISQVALVATKD